MSWTSLYHCCYCLSHYSNVTATMAYQIILTAEVVSYPFLPHPQTPPPSSAASSASHYNTYSISPISSCTPHLCVASLPNGLELLLASTIELSLSFLDCFIHLVPALDQLLHS